MQFPCRLRFFSGNKVKCSSLLPQGMQLNKSPRQQQQLPRRCSISPSSGRQSNSVYQPVYSVGKVQGGFRAVAPPRYVHNTSLFIYLFIPYYSTEVILTSYPIYVLKMIHHDFHLCGSRSSQLKSVIHLLLFLRCDIVIIISSTVIFYVISRELILGILLNI